MQQASSRAEGLRDLDAKLQSIDLEDQSQQDDASKVVETLQENGMVKGFGNANQTPKRLYTLEELKWNKIDTTQLLSPEDTTLNGVQNQLQIALVAGVVAFIAATGEVGYAGAVILLLVFLGGADTVANGGGGRALLVDTLGRKLNSSYSKRVAHHEAGHFLIAYLLGVLPVAYTLSSLDAFRRFGALNVQAGCRFADASFQREVATGSIKATSLGRFACIALAGVCSEYLKFGKSEGGLADLDGLDSMFKGLGFGQNKADGEVRWAVLNTVTLLRRHAGTHNKLAEAMDGGKSVGDCIALLEDDFAKAPQI